MRRVIARIWVECDGGLGGCRYSMKAAKSEASDVDLDDVSACEER